MTTDLIEMKTLLDNVHDSLATFGLETTRNFYREDVDIVRESTHFVVTIRGCKATFESCRRIPVRQGSAFAYQR